MTRPEKLSDIVAPAPLSDLPFWLCWKLEQFNGEVKARKVPYYPSGERRHGTQGAPHDVAKLTTFAAARNAAIKGGFDGVGFAHTEGCGIVTLDFDKCVGPDGNVRQDVIDLVTMTYAEFSPSGKGIHAIFVGDADILGNHKANVDEGADFSVEAFSSSGFTTFTGNTLDHVDIICGADHLEPLPDITIAACRKRFGPQKAKVDPDDFMAGREPRLNLTVEKMQDLLAVLDPSMGREPWLRIGFALHHETEGDDTGFELWDEWSSDGDTYPSTEALRHQWDSFKGGTGKKMTTMRSVLKMAKEAGYSDNECDAIALDDEIAWPDPVPLPDALLAVPPLTEDMLPEELAPWLIDISERMSVSLDFVGIPAMVMMGALIGRKVAVRPEEFTDWSEPANVWGAIVAPPGAMKTPVVNQVLAPIKKFETAAQSENKAALEKHSLDVLFQKSARDAALANAKKNSVLTTAADFEQALMGCALEPPKPRLKRFVTTDATVEKLGEICADNPNGILYHRDELPTLFLELQREERAAVRGFLLTGWAGMEAYTFDRIGRGTTHIEAVNISLFGTAQPQRIMNLVSVSSAKHDDGMIQRLQLVAWPDFVDAWVPADRIPDVAARDAAFACCQRLSELTAVAVEAEKQCSGVIEKTEVFYWGFPLDKLPEKKYQDIKKNLEVEFNFELKNLIVSPRGLSEIYNPEGVGLLIAELLKKIPSLSRKIVVLKGNADANDEINFKKIINHDSIVYINRILSEAELYCLYVNSRFHISIPYSDSLGGGVIEPAELGSIPILSNIPSYIKYLNEHPGILLNNKMNNLMEICEVISSNYYENKKILNNAPEAAENSTANRIIKIYNKILK
jgi:hypothetical protein